MTSSAEIQFHSSPYPRMGVIIVSYYNDKDVHKLVEQLKQQLRYGDYLVVVDNIERTESSTKTEHYDVTANSGKVLYLQHNNGGFGAGCNFGAYRIANEVDFFYFLNPDVVVNDVQHLDKMRKGYGQAAAWQAMLLLPDGTVNAVDNPYHVTGLSWSGHYGQQVTEVVCTEADLQEVKMLSGACLAVTVQDFLTVSGFDEQYFMYLEDADLCWKIVATGGELKLVVNAPIIHNYDFSKSNYKWYYLERNRYLCLWLNMPLRFLLLTLLPNIIIDVLIFFQYLFNRRGILKLSANVGVLKLLSYIIRGRKLRRQFMRITPNQIFNHISYQFNSPMFGTLSQNCLVQTVFNLYYRFLKLFHRE